MKYIKLLKAALIIGNIFSILFIIVSSIINGIDTDRSPLIVAIIAILVVPFVLLIIYGLRAYHNQNDSNSYLGLLLISALFNLAYFYIIYGFFEYSRLFKLFPQWFLFSSIMILLWILNIIAYLNSRKYK